MALTRFDVDEAFNISGINISTENGGVFVYPNTKNKAFKLPSDKYGFRYALLLIFDENGLLTEAGGHLVANKDGTYGSPQLSVNIPPKGFLVAFTENAPKGLFECYETAMENAMLYNATMSVIYPVYGKLDESKMQLKISYNKPKPTEGNTVKFMFVGNSSTYFNGTPIKFKALCKAAGVEAEVDYCTFGSAYLSEFADEKHERGQKYRQLLKTKKYDYIIFQDAAKACYEETEKSLETLIPLAAENKAKSVLYMRYSNDKNPDTRFDSFYRHHRNYTRLANKFGVLCSPSNDGMLKCQLDYPDINLYADDGSHHSKEAGYLIACTWLYTILGISPVGNSYNAQMDTETVKALQQCAAYACETGITYPEQA